MAVYVALLRAVNVGGTGKLPMSELRGLCEGAGFQAVGAFIASGNVVFASDGDETSVRMALEQRLAAYAGKPVGVVVRTSEELAEILAANPFREAPGNRAVVLFTDDPLPADALDRATGVRDERMRLGPRAITIAYGFRMADSRLRISAAKNGTARNMNTFATLAGMAGRVG